MSEMDQTHFWKTSLPKGSIFWSVPKAIPRLIRQKSGKFIKCLTTFQIFKSVHGLSQVSVAQIFLELEIRVWKLYESLTILLKSPERFIFPRLQNLDIPEQMTETRSVGKIWFSDRKDKSLEWNSNRAGSSYTARGVQNLRLRKKKTLRTIA